MTIQSNESRMRDTTKHVKPARIRAHPHISRNMPSTLTLIVLSALAVLALVLLCVVALSCMDSAE